jgi:peptidoglycan hydrolase CwlO-like protein
MKKVVLLVLALCSITIQISAMQRMVRIAKRSVATISRQKDCTHKINRLAKKVAKYSNFPNNCSLGCNVSQCFVYDILNAISKEQNRDACIPQLEKKVEDVFYHISHMKNEIENAESRVTDKKVKSFSERFNEDKKE